MCLRLPPRPTGTLLPLQLRPKRTRRSATLPRPPLCRPATKPAGVLVSRRPKRPRPMVVLSLLR
ncbi:hypothetical protein AB4212_42630, partial [Streptomyces sp. 2MCAF27]